nr:hypothetical protein [uncultured Dyadobacter sp.]
MIVAAPAENDDLTEEDGADNTAVAHIYGSNKGEQAMRPTARSWLKTGKRLKIEIKNNQIFSR